MSLKTVQKCFKPTLLPIPTLPLYQSVFRKDCHHQFFIFKDFNSFSMFIWFYKAPDTQQIPLVL